MKIKKLTNICKSGINSNVLKSIAMIAMLIDHIGYYFETNIPNGVYLACRIIGRISMPIFVYLLVQGFFHTKNYTKYIKRMTIFAVITQVILSILMLINKVYVSEYDILIYKQGNILFTFTLALIVLKILHDKIIIKKWDYNKNMIFKIFIIVGIIGISIFISLDYSVEVIMLAVIYYLIEKMKIMIYMTKSNAAITMKGFFAKAISYEKIKLTYGFAILSAQILINLYYDTSWYMLFSVIPIFLYNGEKGADKKYIKKFFYLFFPIHHALLYLIAMLIMLT